MTILEKIFPNGLYRIEIQINNNLVEYTRYLNNTIDSSTQTTGPFEKVVKELINEGYIEVDKANTLKVDSSAKKSVKILSLKEFRDEYPQIKLSDFPWSIGVIEVHTEDTVINGDLDLNKEGDYHIAEITHLVFLKNLTVNGSI